MVAPSSEQLAGLVDQTLPSVGRMPGLPGQDLHTTGMLPDDEYGMQRCLLDGPESRRNGRVV